MSEPIPPHLLTYDPADWPGKHPEHVISIDALVRREQWRRAQDAWANAHGLDRGQFEHLQREQLAEHDTTKATGSGNHLGTAPLPTSPNTGV